MKTVNIHGKDHPVYAGLLDEAHKQGLVSIKTELLQAPLETNRYMAICKATVVLGEKVFEGIGDATPNNVNKMIAPHIVRMAETRAKGRALRDALNIGEALAEELGGVDDDDANSATFEEKANMYQVNEIKKLTEKLGKEEALTSVYDKWNIAGPEGLTKDQAQSVLTKLRKARDEVSE